jgi:tetratricopeptide (TPR) repeat protein
MRLYSEGLARLRAFDAVAARDLLRQAVAADPSYPLAHSALAKAWQTLGYDQNALQEAKQALDMAGDLSRENHLLIEARYYETSKDWPKAIETYRVLFGFFPDNLEYGLYLAAAQTLGGSGKDALGTLDALEQIGAQTKDDPRIDLAVSEAAAALSDNKLRRDAAERAATQAGPQGAKLLVARARISECGALANLSENEKATLSCEEGKRIYAEAGDRGGLARALHTMAEVPRNQGDFAAAEKLYQQALTITSEIGDQSGMARELNTLGVIAERTRGDFATALEMYSEALQRHREAGNKNGMAAAMGNTANILLAQGRLSEALKYYQDTLKLSEEIGYRHYSALALSNMAVILLQNGDLNRAHNLHQQALEILRQIGDKKHYATTLVFLGSVLSQRGELPQARKLYLEALSIEEQFKNRGDADARLALAELDCNSGNSADAELLARVALEHFHSQKQTNGEISAGGLLARSLLQQGKISESKEAIERALKLSENSQDVLVRFHLAIEHAYLLSATKEVAAAEREARQVVAQARKLGLFRLELEASLAAGEIARNTNPAAGRIQLANVEKKARARGFGLIARKAAAAKGQRTPQP